MIESDAEGHTCLHLCPTPEMALRLLEAGVNHGATNKEGKLAYEMQSPEVRAVIDEFTLFCGQFTFASVDTPDHETFTSVILRGKHKRTVVAGKAPGKAPDIVLKVVVLMIIN